MSNYQNETCSALIKLSTKSKDILCFSKGRKCFKYISLFNIIAKVKNNQLFGQTTCVMSNNGTLQPRGNGRTICASSC